MNLKPILNAGLSVFGLATGVVSFLAWFSITPEQLGQKTFEFTRFALPIISFIGGGLFFLGINKVTSGIRSNRNANRYIKPLRESFIHNLDPEQQAAVLEAFSSPNGSIDLTTRKVRGIKDGISMRMFLTSENRESIARITNDAREMLKNNGDLVATVLERKSSDIEKRQSGYPFSDLSPNEMKFLLRVYDESQVHVGKDNLSVANKLNGKGLIYRSGYQGESGQIIQQCDVELADGLTSTMNAWADELRRELNLNNSCD